MFYERTGRGLSGIKIVQLKWTRATGNDKNNLNEIEMRQMLPHKKLKIIKA